MAKVDELSFRCSSCDTVHTGLFDLACRRPDHWNDGEGYEPNTIVATSTHFLSEDFCIIDGEHFFVRCVLPLPIIGRPAEQFGYGVWSTLSQVNFKLYVDSFDGGDQSDLGPWFGWLSNHLQGYPDTLNLKCDVRPQGGRQRPLIRLHEADHPLVQESRTGITLERLTEIYQANGHQVSLSAFGLH